MDCLINFLTDDTQKSLINMVQNRDETFEYELEAYKRLFIVKKDYCIGNTKSNSKNINSNKSTGQTHFNCRHDDCSYKDSCMRFCDKINDIENKEIERFFEGVRCCYLYWIDSKTTLALEAFDALLKEYDLIDDNPYNENDLLLLHDVENRVFFRARLTNQFLSKKEMFHVPFNKRYNIRNERFSLTGQPILYLGNSIADVVEELGVDISNEEILDKLRVSSFEFISGKDCNPPQEEMKKLKIFDLRCNILQDLKNVVEPTFKRRKFFRNILAEICSFQKRKELEEYAFKEEYVIPQMFAQVLKQNNYDGICYYSTKRFCDYSMDGTGNGIVDSDKCMQYRENLALFTHMSEDGGTTSYDEHLFESMEISMPIATRNVKSCYESDLEKLKTMIVAHYNNISRTERNKHKCSEQGCDTCLHNGKICPSARLDIAYRSKDKAESIVGFYNKVFSRIRIGEKKYCETQPGQLHIQLLIGILNRLLVASELIESSKKYAHVSENNYENKLLKLCNLLGDDEGCCENTKDVHDKGILHKARVVFLYQKNGEDFRIAMYKIKRWENLIYVHDVPEDYEYLNRLKELNINVQKNPDNIGSFVCKQTFVVQRPGGFVIKIDFECVNVEIVEYTDCYNGDDIEWKNKAEIEAIYRQSYDKMSPIYRQAIPILLKQIEVMSINQELEKAKVELK